MIDKFKRIALTAISLLVIVAGVFGILVVTGVVTMSELQANIIMLAKMSAIIVIVSAVLVLLLKLNKK